MPAHNMPAAEVDVDQAMVRQLLQEQFPDLASLGLSPLVSGWDNAVFRLGRDLVVRLPRRAASAVLVEHEQRWLPELAPRLPLPVPVPLRAGRPSVDAGYPWSWSVCPWLPGVVAGVRPPDDLREAARTLGAFVGALRAVPAPTDPPPNPFRGVPLEARDESMRDWAFRLADVVDGERLLARWDELVSTPTWTGPPQWLHGDLHPANVLVDDGRLSAVIDFGDLTAGDPASDLFTAWLLFPPAIRPVFRSAVGDVDDDTWRRAEGWALLMSVAYLANSADNPLMRTIGHRALTDLLPAQDG